MRDIRGLHGLASEVLAELDALCGRCGADSAEALEELNAELEDALLLLEEIHPGEGDWREELDDALEEFSALAGDYRRLGDGIPGLEALARRLEAIGEEA